MALGTTGFASQPVSSATPTYLARTVTDRTARLALTAMAEDAIVYQSDHALTYQLDLVGGEASDANWTLLNQLLEVANTAARTALPSYLPAGLVVKQLDTGDRYLLVDPPNIDTAGGWALRNAGVPSNAPIQPAQAFVDNIETVAVDILGGISGVYIGLKDKGLTHLNYGNTPPVSLIYYLFDAISGGGGTLDLSENALDLATVNGLLALMRSDFSGGGMTLYIDAGTSAIPTNGAANADAWFVVATTSCSINWNVRGGTVGAGGGSALFDSGLLAAEVNALLAFLVANYLSLAWTLDLRSSNAAPTGQGVTDKAALITAGWTVLTN